MARFRGTVQGNRGEASRIGAGPLETSCDGWNRGVTVTARKDYENEELDAFDIEVTGGSTGGQPAHRLAKVAGDGTITVYDGKGEVVTVISPNGEVRSAATVADGTIPSGEHCGCGAEIQFDGMTGLTVSHDCPSA